ncbi:hypothetical protein F2Q70_00002765 [Brassica cretica]|uniref:Uncharacterized protein n=1 Tax=Brassica cretica TaxID=69181 RepID=A0A8S9IQZ1_BRACR|nr:hypothetical protein F2Q70_00002765 [Brassica cretica]
MWTVWSLENDLVSRRLHEDPGIIGDGGTEALLGSLDRVWDPEESRDSLIRSGDRGWNPEVSVIGPGGHMRIQGFSLRSGDRIGPLVYLDPKVVWEIEKVWIRRSLVGTRRFGSGDRWLEPEGLDPEIAGWNPEEPRGSSLDPEILGLEPGGYGGTRRYGARIRTRSSFGTQNVLFFARTVLRLSRQDYYRYLFGFRILPLGSWPLSSSYAVFYFCRKSLTCLEGAGVGVMTQVPGLRCFPRLEKQDLDCSMYFTVLLQ